VPKFLFARPICNGIAAENGFYVKREDVDIGFAVVVMVEDKHLFEFIKKF